MLNSPIRQTRTSAVQGGGQAPQEGDGGRGAALFDALDFVDGYVSPARRRLAGRCEPRWLSRWVAVLSPLGRRCAGACRGAQVAGDQAGDFLRVVAELLRQVPVQP